MDPIERVRERAAARHGIVSRSELALLGLDRGAVHRAVAGGHLVRLSARVFCVGGAPLTRGARAAAGVIEGGTYSHLGRVSALAWWGVPGFELTPIHVVRPFGGPRRGSNLGIMHDTRDYTTDLVTVLDGVTVARPELALFESAADIHPGRLERAVDNAWAMRLVDGRSLHRVLAVMKDRGRKGTAAFREMLEQRPPDYRPPGSNVEARFSQLLELDGQQPMEPQVDLGDEHWVGRVDFVDRDRRIVVEVLSQRYHAALMDVEADRRRFERLRAAGWLVVGVWDHQIWTAGQEVAMMIRSLRASLDSGIRRESRLMLMGTGLQEWAPGGLLLLPVLSAERSGMRNESLTIRGC